MIKDKNKKKGSKYDKDSRSLTNRKADLTPAEKKELRKQKRELRKKNRKPSNALTENEVENLYVLPVDDPVFEEESRELQNRYYLKVSGRFRIAAWISVLIFALWLATMFFAYRDEITVENFRFLMRNVNFKLKASTITSDSEEEASFFYTRDEDRIFAVYKDYFATVGNGRLMICDRLGNSSYDEELGYSAPVLKSSDSYLLCFDRGGNEYSVYTYFNNVGQEKLEYPITDAAISDSGHYALATRDSSLYCVVYVYNGKMKLVQKITRDNYVVSVDLSDDGSKVAVTSFNAESSGKTFAELTIYSTSSEEAIFTGKYENTIPYEARYLSDGSIALVSSDRIRIIGSNGDDLKEFEFSTPGDNVYKYEIDDDRVFVMTSDGIDNTKTKVYEINAERDECYSIDKIVTSAHVADENVIIATSDALFIRDADGNIKMLTEQSDVFDVLCKDGKIYICRPTSMVPLSAS